jgi:hypothetical protein
MVADQDDAHADRPIVPAQGISIPMFSARRSQLVHGLCRLGVVLTVSKHPNCFQSAPGLRRRLYLLASEAIMSDG